jgi:hypothetical protein
MAGEEVDLDVAVAELDGLASRHVHARSPFVRPILWKTLGLAVINGPFDMRCWGF